MKVFNQIGILLGVWAAGEVVSQFIKNIIKLGALNKNVYKKIENWKCRIRK